VLPTLATFRLTPPSLDVRSPHFVRRQERAITLVKARRAEAGFAKHEIGRRTSFLALCAEVIKLESVASCARGVAFVVPSVCGGEIRGFELSPALTSSRSQPLQPLAFSRESTTPSRVLIRLQLKMQTERGVTHAT
jgi:hypothetical protein